jgi:hypothetical protein
VRNIYPAGVYSHLVSTKQNGILLSPRVLNEYDELLVRVVGGGNAKVRYVVQNYPRSTLLYPQNALKSETFQWLKFDLRYWHGEFIHIEIGTGDDQPLDIASEQGRSWFGVTDVVLRKQTSTAPLESGSSLQRALSSASTASAPQNAQELATLYAKTLRECINDWQAGTMTDAQADFMGVFVRHRLIPNTLSQLPDLQPLIAEYRRLEAAIPVATRAPGVHEAQAFDQYLFERGVHNQPKAKVPRRFLEVFNAKPYQPSGSGRLELANDLSNLNNPLVARVIVNRLWQYVFGRGLVATPDNFGALGEEPSHPALLDFLAARFSGHRVEDYPNWRPDSLKDMIRHLVLSETFQLAATKTQENNALDPGNRYLSYFTPRRMEAEAIRDSLLCVAGDLQEQMFGPSVGANEPRRSIYLQVRRNALEAFLSAFDAPEPTSTWGRRDTTNIPAQSLALLNDPFVVERAKRWSERILKDSSLTDDTARIRSMWLTSLGREASPAEIQRALTFLNLSHKQAEQKRNLATTLQSQISSLYAQREKILAPVREKLMSSQPKVSSIAAPIPLARWTFDTDLRDESGKYPGTLYVQGKPTDTLPADAIQQGALLVNERQHVATAPLDVALREKTLEAWVQLDSLSQRNGGVMSLEALDGAEFDALVYAEKEPARWMSGSNFFRRTQNFGAASETTAAREPIHLAITYDAAGNITAYRNGQLYGKSYKSEAPLQLAAGKSHVLFGLRHSPSSPGRHLQGRIFEARLYDRALTAEEVSQSAATLGTSIDEKLILEQLGTEEKTKVTSISTEIQKLESSLAELGNPQEWESGPNQRWQDFAHSLFNFKEFIYLK